ncbi:MAG: Na/Pi cotransporter family protein [Deltaproteobacteria bacterium]|nr:Na/Pi cotransporter family protein [Deltaproteobacteria bacterium]
MLWFLGAVAIFIYGIRVSRIGLQLWGGDRLRGMIASLTDNRLMALAVGAIVTIILQSSSATANILVSFAGAGLMSLSQAMGVLLGADIGTTFVVVLLSIRKISDYAMLILAIGVVLDMTSKKKRTRYISMLFVGFGFIFLGLQLMVLGVTPLKNNELFHELIHFLSQNTLYSFTLAALMTPFFSSAGTIGLVMAFAFSGVLTFEAALPFVLGANLGTCATSVISSFSGARVGKQVAIAHLFFKLTGIAIFLPFITVYAELIHRIASLFPGIENSVSAHIALSHVIFNLTVSILFLPFISQGVWLIEKLVPSSRNGFDQKFAPRYLDEKSLETPALAFGNVKREILRVADLVLVMFRDCLFCYEKSDPDLVAEIEARDDKVDFLDRDIKLFLAKLSQESLTDEQAKMSLNLISTAGAFEEIGDIIVQNILDMAGKKIHRGREFSEEGWSEIQSYHAKILETFHWTISAMTSNDQELAHRVLRSIEHLQKDHEELRNNHIARLQSGLKESFETSSIHLDTLSAFSRIASTMSALVKPILERK